MDLIAEKSFAAFFLITVVLGGGGAFLAGRAIARSWKPFPRLIFYMLLLALAVRFLHWGLFMDATYQSWRDMQGTLLSPYYYAVDTLVLLAMAALGYRLELARQMTRQYGWIYQRTSPLTWRRR
jgi:hypothetical protein